MSELHDKTVLITGAGGSIGSQICEQVLQAGARKLVLVSLTEAGLYTIVRKLKPHLAGRDLLAVLGSVVDQKLMKQCMRGVDVVIHAAAHKHVPICEDNPVIAVENNAIGTYNLALAASGAGVSRFVMISSDKAVRPASVMGATKRLAELVLRSMMDKSAMNISIVRFGNVLDSAGSVLPLWREQIANGGPLTLTDRRCERYFMSISDAVELVLSTVKMRVRPGTYVLDMGPPQRLADIAARLIAESGKAIEIKFIGLRPGEKLTEELHHGGELQPVTGASKIFRVLDEGPLPDHLSILQLWEAARARDVEQTKRLLWSAVA